MEVIWAVTDMAPSSSKGLRYGAFGRSGVTAMVVEVLLGIGGFDMDRGAEMTMVNTDIDVQKRTWEGEVFQVKWTGYRLLSCSRKSVRESGPWGQSRNMSLISLNHRLGLSSWEPRNSCSRWPMNRLA